MSVSRSTTKGNDDCFEHLSPPQSISPISISEIFGWMYSYPSIVLVDEDIIKLLCRAYDDIMIKPFATVTAAEIMINNNAAAAVSEG